MCSDHGYQCIPLRPLSDEAAVEILDFLQVFTADFEIRYGGQIGRGRDASYLTPPAQIRTCSTTAYGSCQKY